MALFTNVPSLFLSDPNQDIQIVTDGTQRDAPHPLLPQGSSRLSGNGSQTSGWCQAQKNKPSNIGGVTHSRCAIERPKGELLFLVWRVDVVAAQNILAEVLMHHTGVIADPQLPQPWNPQQQVLIIDERVGAMAQALVVVPFGPI